MRKIRMTYLSLATAALALGAGAPAAIAQDEPPPEPQAPLAQEIGLLFAQTARQGSLERSKGTRGGNQYVLSLRGVARQTVWFSDRPARQAGHIPTLSFVQSWPGYGFSEDPPNAALTVLDAADHEDTLVLTLGEPRYERSSRTLRYRVQILEDAGGNLSHFDSHNDESVPRRFDHASLFIDDAGAPVINGCVIQPHSQCPGANLRGAVLTNVDLTGSDWHGADLTGASFDHANLEAIDLSGAKLIGASLRVTDMKDADFSDANLSFADLSRREGDPEIKPGPGPWNFASFNGANLYGANLSNTCICSTPIGAVGFVKANLDLANFSGSTLHFVTMYKATKIETANFSNTLQCWLFLPNGFKQTRDCGRLGL